MTQHIVMIRVADPGLGDVLAALAPLATAVLSLSVERVDPALLPAIGSLGASSPRRRDRPDAMKLGSSISVLRIMRSDERTDRIWLVDELAEAITKDGYKASSASSAVSVLTQDGYANRGGGGRVWLSPKGQSVDLSNLTAGLRRNG